MYTVDYWTDEDFKRMNIEEYSNEDFQNHDYELSYRPNKSDTVICVGLFGDYYLSLSKRLVDGKVIIFEPHKERFAEFSETLKKKNISNVIGINKAVSNWEGQSDFVACGGISHLKGYINLRGANEEVKSYSVPIVTLEKELSRMNMSLVDMLIVDAEGSELEILEGCSNLLKKRLIKNLAICAYHFDFLCERVCLKCGEQTKDNFVRKVRTTLESCGYKTAVHGRWLQKDQENCYPVVFAWLQ